MKKPDLIDEIRAVRHQISAEHGHDTKRLCDHYREMEKDYAHRMIKPGLSLASTPSGKKPKR
jgi:hypothetical protein